MKLTPRKSAAAALAAAVAALFAGSAYAVPSVSIGDVSVVEGIPGQRNLVRVPVTLSEAAAQAVSVTVDLRRGEGARFGSDIRRRAETIEIPAGATSGFVRFLGRDDDEFEPTETVRAVISAVNGGGAVIGDGRSLITILDDDIPATALVGSLGTGTGVTRVESTASTDPFDVSDFVLNSNLNNGTSLGGTDRREVAIDANGRPTTGNAAKLALGSFTAPAAWPPATATDASSLPVPNYIRSTKYTGAFDPRVPRAQQWDQGWTIVVNGNLDVWDFNNVAGTALAGASGPTANGTCPAGTTLVGPFSTVIGALANDETGLFDGISGDYDVCRLPATISSTLTLTNDNVYEVADGFPGTSVDAGSLIIQAGTAIYGEAAEAIVIQRGAKIVAAGLVDAPIVFTSKTQLTQRFDNNLATSPDSGVGEWAGLALAGRARSQECPGNDFANCSRNLEGNVGQFGGDNDSDNSGLLRYVVIRHAGNDIDGLGNELNGLTLGAVGRSTRLQYIQVHRGLDDGVEFFGGSVFISNLVVTETGDDAFDFAQGWTGGAQFVYIIGSNDPVTSDPRSIEGGDSTEYTTLPITFPVLANFTALGPSALTAGSRTEQGLFLRGAIRVQVSNSIFAGDHEESCLDIDGNGTFARVNEEGGSVAAPGPHFRISNTIFDCVVNNFDESRIP